MYQITTATKKLANQRSRIRGVAGGTSAGKTIGILQLLIDDAQTDTTPTLTSVTAESFPHLKRGAMRDFLDIMQKHNYFEESAWNKTDYIYTLPNKSQIEFFSLDQPSKVRGPRRDRLFINEANNNQLETFEQLEVRTKEYVWLDWNPTNEFWWYTDVKSRQDASETTLTYKDNEALDPEIVRSIEARRGNHAWWQVYGLGQLGDVEARIYTDWQIIDEIDHNARLDRYGLDFGYTNDPTAIVAIYYHDGGYILDEIAFQRGLSNQQIADIFMAQPRALVKADSAEPKSIAEIRSYGINILGVIKGKDSVRQGIQYVQDQRISVTKQSTNLIKGYRNYLWETDRDGKIINVPSHNFSDCLDAVRYGFEGLRQRNPVIAQQQRSILAGIRQRGEVW